MMSKTLSYPEKEPHFFRDRRRATQCFERREEKYFRSSILLPWQKMDPTRNPDRSNFQRKTISSFLWQRLSEESPADEKSKPLKK